jgi:hypothetical protein
LSYSGLAEINKYQKKVKSMEKAQNAVNYDLIKSDLESMIQFKNIQLIESNKKIPTAENEKYIYDIIITQQLKNEIEFLQDIIKMLGL